LAREVVANSEISDLGELFVRQGHGLEGSGWLLGSADPDLLSGETEALNPPATSAQPSTPIDARNTIQLSLF
jgi:hypothetical protein